MHLLGSRLPWLFTRNAAEELVWVTLLPALLSAEGQHLSAVLSQVVYPEFENEECGMLLVVLTSVSWYLGQDSASFPWDH